ncbi:hypothetical protein [Paracoccus actinidiae]|uniref:hypothetical protein n=1 Tax=Paracoccus actinidiae TaxID=3064531 RepID=UPI0027D31EB9|nr:hypothetical protein [Paracoccus sp. M09]
MIKIIAALLASAVPATSQERHLWQEAGTFEPYSRTAQAITGDMVLSGNPDFAAPGSKMTVSFASQKPIDLVSVGATWRKWDVGGDTLTAETFELAKDPGTLLNGNTLCSGQAHYVVFTDPWGFNEQIVSIAVFSGKTPPADIDSEGLCGTFNYYPPR